MQFLLNHISIILDKFTGTVPLPIFLKDYFKQHPKLGSRDRRAISEAVFIYYRYASFFTKDKNPFSVIVTGITKGSISNAFLQKVFANIEPLDECIDWDRAEKQILLPEFSAGINKHEWLSSLLEQPRLFIRLRNNHEKCLQLLIDNNIDYLLINNERLENSKSIAVSLPNGTSVAKLIKEEDYVVQDLSSQQSVKLLLSHISAGVNTAWDVCSGAGGKSIYLKDELAELKLLSTDIRKTILHNLALRFKQYNLKQPKILVLDSTNKKKMAEELQQRKFDLIICDVPCTGSGTWARTPEEFHFFDAGQLNKFEELQYPIALNAQEYLSDNGLFAYITCSVFKQENEDVVAKILANTNLQLLEQTLIKGIESHADSMFCAIFKKR